MVRLGLFALIASGLAACGADREAPAAPAPPASTPAAAPSAVAPPVTAGEFDAVGTEPFWAVQVRGDSLTLSRPDHDDLKIAAPAPEARGGGFVWTGDGMVVSIAPGACSDGMSDRKYVYEALVRAGSEILKGCAYRPGAAPSATPES